MTCNSNPLNCQAAVLIALAGEGEDERILLTQRAAHLTLHSGEVAFPGGKWEEGDASLAATAIRETHEEVGIKPDLVEMLGPMPARYTSRGMRVTPFVGRVPEDVEPTANLGELESFFWVPTAFLLEDQRVRTDLFEVVGGVNWAPVYDYMGYTIWGFTARVLVEFVNDFWSASISEQHTAPREIYKLRR